MKEKNAFKIGTFIILPVVVCGLTVPQDSLSIFRQNLVDQRDSTVFINQASSVPGQPCPDILTVIDHEGNVYNTVQIGSQCWTKENMKCTSSPTGKSCIQLSGNQPSTWAPYYAVPSNSAYGVLYNWHAAVDTNLTTAIDCTFDHTRRGICPQGWHVPTDAEWRHLTDFLGGDGVIGGEVKSTSSLWDSPNIGATNESGFSALPAGAYNNGFNNADSNAYFWSSTQNDNVGVWNRHFSYDYADCNSNGIKYFGFSVRCCKD
ncbi:MAG: fibrobacter succinogenes major paralogous domain-containing protein [Bacteroidales bacterium]